MPCKRSGRADWTAHQLTAAIGADAVQNIRRAIGAKGAFERADHRVATFRWEIAIAAFAVGAQCQHGIALPDWFVHGD